MRLFYYVAILGFLISCDTSKNDFADRYFQGDYDAFQKELDKTYDGNFESMQNTYDLGGKEVDKYLNESSDSTKFIKREIVTATANISAIENNGEATVCSIPRESGRAIYDSKNNDQLKF